LDVIGKIEHGAKPSLPSPLQSKTWSSWPPCPGLRRTPERSRGAARASTHGLGHAVDGLLPHSLGLPALWAIAGVSALSANLPATLVLLHGVARTGAGAVLAMLIGVGATVALWLALRWLGTA
jgi:hypothetical protein